MHYYGENKHLWMSQKYLLFYVQLIVENCMTWDIELFAVWIEICYVVDAYSIYLFVLQIKLSNLRVHLTKFYVIHFDLWKLSLGNTVSLENDKLVFKRSFFLRSLFENLIAIIGKILNDSFKFIQSKKGDLSTCCFILIIP